MSEIGLYGLQNHKRKINAEFMEKNNNWSKILKRIQNMDATTTAINIYNHWEKTILKERSREF